MAASGTGSLFFIDDVTADGNIRMNSGLRVKGYSPIKVIGWCFTVDGK